jgi:probable rRNA maturation factor
MDDDPHLDADRLRILISNRQERPVDEEGLRAIARDTMRGEGIERAELSVSFVEQDEIAGLHERFMDEPGPTDVLSFPLDGVDEDDVRLLGDVVVAPAEAARNNPSDPEAELRLLLVHGILHLLGYDHGDEMEAREAQLL